MALFENFPYTNLHELNLDWLINNIKAVQNQQVLSVNGQTGEVILYQEDTVRFPDITSGIWQIVRDTNGHTSGIYFNDSTGLAYIVNGDTLERIYTVQNPPAESVTSVNGLTGDVVLYEQQYVQLPSLTGDDLHNWNLYRKINGTNFGIQFEDDGKVYAMNGVNRYLIYSADNPPPYPVTSVNNATGDVVLYPEQDIELPGLSSNYHDWSLSKALGSVQIGLRIADTGAASIIKGSDEYPIYIQGILDPSDFTDPTDEILELAEPSTTNDWGLIRENDNNDTVGIAFLYDSVNQVYNAYLKVGNTTEKLLTLADIPSGSGVVSINGQTGVVVMTGEDLNTSSLDSTPVSTSIADLQDNVSALNSGLAIVVNGNTASVNINPGDYVLVINSTITGITDGLYLAVNSVTAGVALVAADLDDSSLANGALNKINQDLNKIDLIENSTAIIVNGNTASVNINTDDFILVINSTITGITDGLYICVNNIPSGTPLTSADLDNSLTVNGGFNALAALIPNVLNVLNSTSTSDALSAAQGKALSDKWSDASQPRLLSTGNLSTIAAICTKILGANSNGIVAFGITYALGNTINGHSGAGFGFAKKNTDDNKHPFVLFQPTIGYITLGTFNSSGNTVTVNKTFN